MRMRRNARVRTRRTRRMIETMTPAWTRGATEARPSARRDLGGDAASEDARYQTVFVGGVHHECDEERLREFFESEHGEVESVKIDTTNRRRARARGTGS